MRRNATNEVEPNFTANALDEDGLLWQGSEPVHDDEVNRFDVIVDMTLRGGDYKVREGAMHVRWPIDDSFVMPDEATLRALAHFVRAQVLMGKRVLVHCAAGLNRSGLVVGATLRADGLSGPRAVKAVKEARGKWALSNPVFRDWVANSEWPERPATVQPAETPLEVPSDADDLIQHLKGHPLGGEPCADCWDELEIRRDSLGIEAVNLYEDHLLKMDEREAMKEEEAC